MSGAGETRRSRLELLSDEAERNFSSPQTPVRLYWKNGMTWTLYRSGQSERRGWRAIPLRAAAKFRSMRKYLLKVLMQPWP
jgi:hypothetical protein